MAASTTTASELTAEQVLNLLVRPLEDASAFLAAGPRIFDTTGPLRLPKLDAPEAPSWHGENELIDEVDQEFDEITLLPSTMKSVKSLTRYSNELARQSTVNLDQALKDRLVKDVADTMDAQLFSASAGKLFSLLRWPSTICRAPPFTSSSAARPASSLARWPRLPSMRCLSA